MAQGHSHGLTTKWDLFRHPVHFSVPMDFSRSLFAAFDKGAACMGVKVHEVPVDLVTRRCARWT